MKNDIILAGVGGQGILSIATILGAASLSDNLNLKQAEVHGMSQRGGDVMSCLRLSSEPIASDLIPMGRADMIVSLEPMEALRYRQWLHPGGWIVTNTVPVVNIPTYPPAEEIAAELEASGNVIAFDMDKVAAETASARASNMVLLGAASLFIDLSPDSIEEAIAAVFATKGDRIIENNINAFRAGRKEAEAMRK